MLASGRAEGRDLGVHGFELAHRAAEQDHFGAGRGERQRHGAANAGTSARDHDDAASKFLGCRHDAGVGRKSTSFMGQE